MNPYNEHSKLLKTALFIALILVIFISTVSFSHKYYSVEEKNSQIGEITKEFATIQGAMKLDSKRQYAIQKVLNILNQYNRTMPESEKLAIANEIYNMTMRYSNLNIDLICATITHESARTWRKDVVSPVGALGLMQIMPPTGEKLAQEEGIDWTTPEKVLFDPLVNIRLGCRYLSNLIHLYEIDGGLAAYNGGEKRAALWLKNRTNKTDWTLLWEETRTYVPAILKLYEKYQQQTKIL